MCWEGMGELYKVWEDYIIQKKVSINCNELIHTLIKQWACFWYMDYELFLVYGLWAVSSTVYLLRMAANKFCAATLYTIVRLCGVFLL